MKGTKNLKSYFNGIEHDVTLQGWDLKLKKLKLKLEIWV